VVQWLVECAALRVFVLEFSNQKVVKLRVLSELQVSDFAFGDLILKHFLIKKQNVARGGRKPFKKIRVY